MNAHSTVQELCSASASTSPVTHAPVLEPHIPIEAPASLGLFACFSSFQSQCRRWSGRWYWEQAASALCVSAERVVCPSGVASMKATPANNPEEEEITHHQGGSNG